MKLIRVDPNVRPLTKRVDTKKYFIVTGLLVGTLILSATVSFLVVINKAEVTPKSNIVNVANLSAPIHRYNSVSRGGVERSAIPIITPTATPTNTPTPTPTSTPIPNIVLETSKGSKPQMSQEVFETLDRVAKELGLPREIWYPIAMYESAGNPKCHATKGEDSRGIFQVNIRYHKSASPTRLFETEYNARYQMPTLLEKYKEGKSYGISGVDLTKYVARYGQRPAWNNARVRNYINSTINYYYKNCP